MFTLFCHRYSAENIDNFFKSPLLAESFYILRDEIRALIPGGNSNHLMNAILDRLIQKAQKSYE